MDKTVEHLAEQLQAIRFGTITSGLIDSVRINCYGGTTEIRHLAMTQNDKKRICVTPYDPSLIGTINTALNSAGFNSYVFSKTSIVVSIPQPCGEEKEKVVKHVRKLGEEAKVAIRNIRKKAKKEHDEDEVQKVTDSSINEIEEWVESKVQEIS